jgi:hypothetical protein
MAWTAYFFVTEAGVAPARVFLDGLDVPLQMRLATRVQAVEQSGFSLGGGIFEICHGYSDLFEIRVRHSRRLARLYCTVDGDRLILVSGLLKMENEATPAAVLIGASEYIAEYRRTKRIVMDDED